MLPEQTMEKLYAMKLNGIADAWQEQRQQPHSTDLSFDERLALLVERQWIWKENRALATRLQYARLKQAACLEDIDFRHPRKLKRATIDQLASCEWIRHRRHCLITGPTGVGKSYLACALAHKACREGFRALYYYGPKLFRELNLAQADGSLTRLLKKLARVDLLLIDDWALTPLQPDQYRLFLEILDDRTGATLLTSQYPIHAWHELVGEPTVGDAILDRVVHNAYKLELDGDSLRKKNARKAEPTPTQKEETP